MRAGWQSEASAGYHSTGAATATGRRSTRSRFVTLPIDITRKNGTLISAFRTLVPGLWLVAAGCTTAAGASVADQDPQVTSLSDGLDLEAPENGIQLVTARALVEPGDDEHWCEVLQLPGGLQDAYYVTRIDAETSPSARRMVVSAAIPGSETEANMTVGDRVPCVRAGEVFGDDLVEVIASGRGYASAEFPESVGRIYFGGQKLAVDLHYVGDGEQPALARARINFHRADAADVQHLARTAVFNNLTIYTPPGGQSSHVAQCTFDSDVVVSAIARRTNEHGRDFTVWYAGGERDGQLIWTSHDWANQTRFTFPQAPISLRAGEGFRFQCDYANPTAHDLRFGSGSSDEQCMLVSTFWLAQEDHDTRDQRCLLLPRDVTADGIAAK